MSELILVLKPRSETLHELRDYCVFLCLSLGPCLHAKYIMKNIMRDFNKGRVGYPKSALLRVPTSVRGNALEK